MASSSTDIANRALTKLGEEHILSLTDDRKPARVLNGMFAQVRDAELRRNYWNFALKRSQLVALTAAPDWGYAYQYPLPNDFLALVQVGEFYCRPGTKHKGAWTIEGTDTGGSVILTDMLGPLKIRYVKRVENSGLFDPLFVETFACKLAFEACEALTQSSSKKESAGKEYLNALRDAVRADAIELPPDEFPTATWILARESFVDVVAADYFPSGYVPPAPTPAPAPSPVPPSDSLYADAYATDYA